MEMLDKVFVKIPENTNLILHSDQGWQYQQVRYQERLRKKESYKVCQGKEIVWIML